MAATANQPATYEFPSSWRASLSHWWSSDRAAGSQAERALVQRGLGNIPLVDADTPVDPNQRRGILRQIQLAGHPANSPWYINLLEIGKPEKQPNEHAFVCLHGYGNGLAFWWQNYNAMSSLPDTRTYFIDWLGMGRSGRPSFPSIRKGSDTSEKDMQRRVEQAEDFFVSSLEDFRQQEKIEKFTLIGHSIGGYLSSAYALKYPHRVHKLILVSPVGVPESKYEQPWETSSRKQKMPKDMQDADRESAQALEADMMPASTSEVEVTPKETFQKTYWSRLWELNVSPFSIVRSATFYGPALLSRYAARRFKAFPEEVQPELFNYLYHISKDKGSGEFCLAHLLAPGAFARWPLVNRLGRLDIPISMIYGDNDWMDERGGYAVLDKLKAKPSTTAADLQRKRSKVVINQHSGHWVFLENPKGFDKIVLREMQEAIQDSNA